MMGDTRNSLRIVISELIINLQQLFYRNEALPAVSRGHQKQTQYAGKLVRNRF